MIRNRPNIHYALGGGAPPGGGGVPGAAPGAVGANQHLVRFNDHISHIAVRNSYRDWHTLWAKNATLQGKPRSNPHMLFHGDRVVPQGDIVELPPMEEKEEACATEQVHTFVVPDSKLFLRLRILDEHLQPFTNADYELVVNGKRTTGNTGADAIIEQEVPDYASDGYIVLTRALTPPAPAPGAAPGTPGAAPGGAAAGSEMGPSEIQVKYRFPLHIGRLDPIQEQAPDNNCTAGVQARLNNLGFECGHVDGRLDAVTEAAIKRFQRRLAMTPVDGQPTAATQQKLFETHDQKTPVPPPPAPPPAAPPPGGGGGGPVPPPP